MRPENKARLDAIYKKHEETKNLKYTYVAGGSIPKKPDGFIEIGEVWLPYIQEDDVVTIYFQDTIDAVAMGLEEAKESDLDLTEYKPSKHTNPFTPSQAYIKGKLSYSVVTLKTGEKVTFDSTGKLWK